MSAALDSWGGLDFGGGDAIGAEGEEGKGATMSLRESLGKVHI